MFHTENGSWSRGQLNQCQLNLQHPESPHINTTYGSQNIHLNEIINSWYNWTRSYLHKNCSIQNLITGHYGKLWEMSAERQHGYPCQSIKLHAASPHITGHYGKLWEMSAKRQHGYPCQSIKLHAASPHILSKCQANCTLCKYPIQFLGSNTNEQYLTIISSGPNTWDTETSFSRCSRAHWTFSSMVPPLSWISMMCAFFWRFFSSFI